MEFSAHVAHAGSQQSPCELQSTFALRLPNLGLLRKISRVALFLILIRIFSAAGFVLTLWLCPIHVFANLGIYLASVSLAALAVFGRYELLIVAAEDEQKCADAVHLCLITGICVMFAIFAAAISVHELFITHITLFFAGALFARAWLRLGLIFATRYGRYDRAVKALLPHTIVQPVTLVLLTYSGYNPLLAFILSDFVGHLVAAICVCISEWRAFLIFFCQKIRFRQAGKLAMLNYGLPTLNLTAAASAFLFATAPLFFLPTLQNGILAGTLALLFRVLDVPTSVTTASIGPILMKEVAERNRDGTQWMSSKTFLLPATVAAAVFGSISLGGLSLNDLDITPSWHMALTILPVVALFQAGIAATSPLIDIATLAGRQKGLASLNVISVLLAASVLLFWSHNPIIAIMLAGSIGFARVFAMTVLLVAHGKAGISGATELVWSAFPKIKPMIAVQP